MAHVVGRGRYARETYPTAFAGAGSSGTGPTGATAVKNGLCVSCAKYDDLQKKITAKDAPKPKAPAGAPK